MLYFISCLLPLVLLLGTTEKRLALSDLFPCRYMKIKPQVIEVTQKERVGNGFKTADFKAVSFIVV